MRKLLASFAIGILALAGSALALATGSPHDGKQGICHATGSQKNPFVYISPDKSGVFDGHLKHGGDIIPAFSFTDSHGKTYTFPGQNLTTVYFGSLSGQDLLNNKCMPPKPGETSTTTTTVPTTVTVPTTTTVPVTTTVTTPGVTTTVTTPTKTVTLPATTVTTPAVTTPAVTVTSPGATVTLPEKTVTITTPGSSTTKTVIKVKKIKVPVKVKCAKPKKHKHHRAKVKTVSHQRPRLAG